MIIQGSHEQKLLNPVASHVIIFGLLSDVPMCLVSVPLVLPGVYIIENPSDGHLP